MAAKAVSERRGCSAHLLTEALELGHRALHNRGLLLPLLLHLLHLAPRCASKATPEIPSDQADFCRPAMTVAKSQSVNSAKLGGVLLPVDGCLEKSEASVPSVDSFIFSFRQAHGASHEAAIETSALLGASKPSLRRAHAPSDGAALSVMVGEDLLINGRRLVGVLRRQGVKLLETSMELPHLILDHESGLLACDVATVRHPATSR